jgi:DNA-binding transcriptional ArsR family regulator
MSTKPYSFRLSHLEHRVQMLKAVAHPVRLSVIAALAERPLHVNALSEALGYRQPIVSQQLRILRMMRLVEARRERGLAVYHLAETRLLSLLSCLDHCCEALDEAAPRPLRAAGSGRKGAP